MFQETKYSDLPKHHFPIELRHDVRLEEVGQPQRLGLVPRKRLERLRRGLHVELCQNELPLPGDQRARGVPVVLATQRLAVHDGLQVTLQYGRLGGWNMTREIN